MKSLPDIDFLKIRPHHKSRHGGFEELSVQLFRSNLVHFAEFTRVEGAGGDEGVEAFVVLKDGKKIGIQAKYFDKLGGSQWRQIGKSVEAALEHHPAIVEYRVAVPLNRSPTNKKKWDALIERWQESKKQKGIRHRIRFVWLGASELEDLLTTPAQRDKLLYWFGCRQFSDEWLDQRNESTIANLDCRYTPKHHVRTESEALLDAFALTDPFVRNFYRWVKTVFDAGRKLIEKINSEQFPKEARSECETLLATLREEKGGFGDGKKIPPSQMLVSSHRKWVTAGECLLLKVMELNRPKKPDGDAATEIWHERPFDYLETLTRSFLRELQSFEEFFTKYKCADASRLLVLGPAGSGKSRLLATVVLEARKRGQPALILLGEHFLAKDEPWTQLCSVLGWEGTVDELLAALNHSAEIYERPALVCIDALNESGERSLWRSHLNSFASRLNSFAHIRLLISCRIDFAQLTLPDALAKQTDSSWVVVEHTGFGDKLFDAVGTYFSGYKVQTNHFPPLLEEFQTPLFLKTFCEAFENSRLPKGTITLDTIIRRRVSNICGKLATDIDCPAEVTREGIMLIANAIEKNHGRAVPQAPLRSKLDALFPRRGDSRSLYRHLKSNGLLVEIRGVHDEPDSEAAVLVRFPYERFSEYFIADRMLHLHRTASQLELAWAKDGTLARFNDSSEFWKLRGLMLALAILLPERFGIEVADIVKNPELTREVLEDFLASLPWRSPTSFNQRSKELFRSSQQLGLGTFLQAILRVSTIPGHPYNADYLHHQLKQMRLAVRDEVWTVQISKLTTWGGNTMANLVVKWAFYVPLTLVSDEQALLVARILAWFCSSNHKAFRLRATLAAIRVLQNRCVLAEQLVRDFHDCNDPYVAERVFAIACGVAMREKNKGALKHLAAAIQDTIFSKGAVPAHILLRDYAQCVLELAHLRDCLPEGVTLQSVRPPYKSKWPRIWTEARVKPLEQSQGWNAIKYSVQPECTGHYGDFGRYVMQSAVHRFSAVSLNKKFPKNSGDKVFSAMTARRWIIQRVKQLGWTPQRFERYERNVPFQGRKRVDIEELRVERISKKYQWIALHEFQAYLSDHYHLALDYGEEEPALFEGAWQLWARDLDPSQPLQDLADEDVDNTDNVSSEQHIWWNKFPDPFGNERLVSDREAWVTAPPEDFRKLIELDSPPNHPEQFLALAGYYNWKEELPFDKAEREIGRLEMWAHIRTWLVRREHLQAFLAKVRDIHFWGHGSHLVGLGRGWIGEYPWAAVYRDLRLYCERQDDWIGQIDIPTVQAVCHKEEKTRGIFPSPQLCEILKIRWAGRDFDFVDNSEGLVAFSPLSYKLKRTPPCIVSRSKLVKALQRSNWDIVWAVLGERRCYSLEAGRYIVDKRAEFSGVFYLSRGEIVGGLTKHLILDIS
jgi:hypothetical protein